jgi:hypothetical protein
MHFENRDWIGVREGCEDSRGRAHEKALEKEVWATPLGERTCTDRKGWLFISILEVSCSYFSVSYSSLISPTSE